MSEQGTPVAAVPTLDDILVTNELTRRKPRPPDHKVEADALHSLARRLAGEPLAIVRELVALAVRLCGAGSAGLSLLEEAPPEGKPLFRWVALAGAYEPFEGGVTPANFSPCGTCLERQASQLYAYPARLFTYFEAVEPPIVEALVVPLPDAPGQPRGAIWIVSHDETRKFDGEDVRLMASLADFTAAALRSASAREAAEEAARCARAAHAAAEQEADRRRQTEDVLRVQGRKLAEADRNKDLFLAQLAHELRNPLSSLLNGLHLIRLQGGDAGVREQSLDLAARQVQQLTRLIDGLLDLARVRQGKMALKLATVDLNAVVARAVETVRPAVEGRCHELEIAVPLGPVLLRADASRLEQVLVNLLHNAAKYTEVGGRIRLTVQRGDGEAVVRVRDTGIGLSPDVAASIFDLYAQEERAQGLSQGGLGIGLSLVRGLVEMHGGRVHAFSEGPGRGSEFMLCLPTLPEALPPPRNASPARPALLSSGLRVLLVDDNLDSSDSLAMLLRIWGHRVEVAPDGPGALDAARAVRPDVVLLDIGLPGMDGHEVGRRLRLETGLEGMLLVALTGYGAKEDHEHSRESGFDLHFVKPVDAEALRELLAQHGARVAAKSDQGAKVRPRVNPPQGRNGMHTRKSYCVDAG